jgi:hypothetical protein
MMIPVQPTGFLPAMPSNSHVFHGSHHRSGPQVEIFVDSITLYLYCVISIKISNSGDVYIAQKCTSFLFASEVQECARAIAIMAYRFEPEACNQLISAHEIVKLLGDLPDSKIPTFRIDIDSLKKAFSSQIIRDALTSKFPHKFQFTDEFNHNFLEGAF